MHHYCFKPLGVGYEEDRKHIYGILRFSTSQEQSREIELWVTVLDDEIHDVCVVDWKHVVFLGELKKTFCRRCFRSLFPGLLSRSVMESFDVVTH